MHPPETIQLSSQETSTAARTWSLHVWYNLYRWSHLPQVCHSSFSPTASTRSDTWDDSGHNCTTAHGEVALHGTQANRRSRKCLCRSFPSSNARGLGSRRGKQQQHGWHWGKYCRSFHGSIRARSGISSGGSRWYNVQFW